MPDFANFARRMRQIAREFEEGSNRAIIEAAVRADQLLVLGTPVDTGRARANWQVNIGSPILAQLEQEDPSGTETISRNTARIRSRRSEQSIFISNNVPYIVRLNEGSSSQAPAMFIQTAVATAVGSIRRARILR